MTNENSEILQMLLSEDDDDDIHLALILIMEGKVKISQFEMVIFYEQALMSPGLPLYFKVQEWIGARNGQVFPCLRELAEKSQELSNQ